MRKTRRERNPTVTHPTLGLKLLNPALLQPAKTRTKSAVAAAGNMKVPTSIRALLAAATGRGNHLCIYSRISPEPTRMLCCSYLLDCACGRAEFSFKGTGAEWS